MGLLTRLRKPSEDTFRDWKFSQISSGVVGSFDVGVRCTCHAAFTNSNSFRMRRFHDFFRPIAASFALQSGVVKYLLIPVWTIKPRRMYFGSTTGSLENILLGSF